MLGERFDVARVLLVIHELVVVIIRHDDIFGVSGHVNDLFATEILPGLISGPAPG